MNNSFWRLAALSGVVGLGLLVVFQAQKGLDLNTLGKAFGVNQGAADGAAAGDDGQDGTSDVGDQTEPLLGPESISRANTPGGGLTNSDDPFATGDKGSIQTASNAAVSRRLIQTSGVDFRQIEEEDMGLNEEPALVAPARRVAPRLTADSSDEFNPGDTPSELAAPGTEVDNSPEIGLSRKPPRRAIGSKVTGLFDNEADQSAPPTATTQTPARPMAVLTDSEPETIEVPARKPAPRLSAELPSEESSTTRWTSPATAPAQPARTLAAPGSILADDEPLMSDESAPPTIRLAQSDEPSPAPASADDRPAKRAAPVVKPSDADDATFLESERAGASRERSQPVDSLTPNPSPPVGRGESSSQPFPRVDGDNSAITASPRGQQRPQLSIDKVAPQAAVLGQPMVYTIRVRNVGTIPAHQVVVEDRVPRGVQLDGTNPRAEMSEKTKTLIWKLGTLESGQERTISVRIVPTNEGPIGSVATVNFSTEVSSHTVVSAATLRLELLAAERATLGQPVPFTFRVTNTGRTDATGVVIRNVLPAALRHSDGDDLEYAVGTLPAGKTKEVTLSVTAAQAGKVVNQAVVTADGGVSVQAEAAVLVQGATIDVARSGPKRLFPKKNGRFTNIITNPTSQPMLGVTVTETIPAGVEYIASSPEGDYNPARRSVTWNVERLAARESRTFEITLASAETGSKVSVVRAFDGTGASGEKVATMSLIGAASLAIEVTDGQSPLEVGESVTYRIKLSNRGTDAATNVRALATIPIGMQVTQIGGQLRFRQTANRIEFEPIPRLEPGGSSTATITVRATRPGDIRLHAQVSSDQMPTPLTHEEAATVYAP
jgi:uncharacterized repeat protein (TIGR01451 family)